MPVQGKAVVIGGGTFSHIRSHLALAAPAFGQTAEQLGSMLRLQSWPVDIVKTRMAGGGPSLVTNEDVADFVDTLVRDPNVKVIVMNVALCDFNGAIMDGTHATPSGKDETRLQTSEGGKLLGIHPAGKILSRIRKVRKDIFLVGFKTTVGADYKGQYQAGLKLLKQNSCNLVLANDVLTRYNMIITPEQAIYGYTSHRQEALDELSRMITARANLTFTRSTVVQDDLVPWASPEVPDSLRKVVDHCIALGAYKPFLDATVGHFAVKLRDGEFITSIRKSNFNRLSETGLVRVETVGEDKVIAHGARPSVGGQSQRIVFDDHPGLDCIVHAHIPLKSRPTDNIPIRSQWPYECGSHACGKNTSDGLKDFGGIRAVMLDKHGPNIVFNRGMDPSKVISFIEANWDLSKSTDGVLTAPGEGSNM